MTYDDFIASLESASCPPSLDSYQQALWYDAKGDWDKAHRIVQAIDDPTAARIHAYLHHVEGDDWNSKYWHRMAGSEFPEHLSLEEEWDMLVGEEKWTPQFGQPLKWPLPV